MEDNNPRISATQFLVLGIMIGNALFVGMGNIILVQIAKENTWIVAILGAIVGILPVLILVKIMNYKPSLNLIEKIKVLFGPFIGHIINFIIIIIVSFCFIITTWSVCEFATTKYLSETPFFFVSLLFIIPVIYAGLKGIETISRTNQMLFIINTILFVIITFSLLQFVEIKNIKPILADGFNPIIKGVYQFITYCFTPFITLLIIPKTTITEQKKVNKFFILGYIIAAANMIIVFFVGMSTLGVNISSMYRYPEYYVIKKISIGQAFDNIENFLSVHWKFYLFAVNMLSIYYLKQYLIDIFKIKKEKTKNIVTVIIGLAVIIIVNYIFPVSTEGNYFMNHFFPWTFGLALLIIITIIILKIIIDNKKEEKNINT